MQPKDQQMASSIPGIANVGRDVSGRFCMHVEVFILKILKDRGPLVCRPHTLQALSHDTFKGRRREAVIAVNLYEHERINIVHHQASQVSVGPL